MTMLELTGERILEKLYENAEVSNKTGRLPNTVEEAATDLQMNFENAIANDEGNLLKGFDKKTVRKKELLFSVYFLQGNKMVRNCTF